MSDVTETPEPQSTNSSRPPPWDQLRQARESRNLAQTDIASELRIDLRFIKALDEGEIEKLPEPVFTAGYIRGYAKIVGLPADDLIAGYAEYDDKVKAPIVPVTSSKDKQEKMPVRYGKIASSLPDNFSVSISGRDHLKNLRYAIIATAVIVVAVIVWQMNKSEEISGELTLEDATGLTSMTMEKTTMEKSGENQPVANSPAEEAKPGKVIPGVNKISDDTTTVDLAIPGQKKPPGYGLNGNNAGNLSKEELEKIAAKMSSISLQFSKDSWVDIRDATGRHLIRSLGVAGQEKNVKGFAPFEVLLGYGPGVTIEYNGKPYDFSEHQAKNEVARFVMEKPPKSR